MEKERKVVEPSAWDKWRAMRAEKRAQRPRTFVVAKGNADFLAMFTGTALLIVAVLWDATVAFAGWFFSHIFAILIIGGFIFAIVGISTSPTSGLKHINLMWEEHPGMRPHITEAAKDGTISKWERMGLDGTLQKLIEGLDEAKEKKQLQYKIDAEQQK